MLIVIFLYKVTMLTENLNLSKQTEEGPSYMQPTQHYWTCDPVTNVTALSERTRFIVRFP